MINLHIIIPILVAMMIVIPALVTMLVIYIVCPKLVDKQLEEKTSDAIIAERLRYLKTMN